MIRNFIFSLMIFIQAFAGLDEVIKAIEETNPYDSLSIINIYQGYKDSRLKIIIKSINSRYKYALLTIAIHESGNFKFKRGLYDKMDVSYFQLSWRNKAVRKFSAICGCFTKQCLMNNTKIAAKVALTMWIYNIYIFYQIRGYIPKYLQD